MIENHVFILNPLRFQQIGLHGEREGINEVINIENSIVLMKILQSEANFQAKLFRMLRKKLIDLIPFLIMNESRKSYLLHQATAIWDIRYLMDVVNDINTSQSTNEDLIQLKETDHGFTFNIV